MLARKRVMQAKQRRQRPRRFYEFSMDDVRTLLSALVIPLIFGLITIFTTVYQLKQTENHWKEHMNFSRGKELDDDNKSRIQREEYSNISRIQREESSNISRMQREQDWKMSQTAQNHTNEIANYQYRNKVFLDYMKDIGSLLEKNKGSLTNKSLPHILARVKTLNVLQHLNGLQQRDVIRFLSEAKQLTNTNKSIALDISSAKLSSIYFDQSSSFLTRENVSLAGVHLHKCMFDLKSDLKNVNFSSTRLERVKFSFISLYNVNFSSANLNQVNFLCPKFVHLFVRSVYLRNVDFSSAGLDNVSFSSARLVYVNFSSAVLKRVSLSSVSLNKVDFSSARLHDVNFLSAGLYHVKFSVEWISRGNFSSARLDNVNFSSNTLDTVEFSSAQLDNVNFSSNSLNKVKFSSAQLDNVNFSSANLSNVDFSSAQLANVHFSSVQFISNDQALFSR